MDERYHDFSSLLVVDFSCERKARKTYCESWLKI